MSPFQPRQSSGPSADTLQLPDPEYNHDFQGMAGNEEGQDGSAESNQVNDQTSETQNPDRKENP